MKVSASSPLKPPASMPPSPSPLERIASRTWLKPQAESATQAAVMSTRTRKRRRRAASRMVSQARSMTGALIGADPASDDPPPQPVAASPGLGVGVAGWPAPTASAKRSSSVAWRGSTAWTRPPAATRVETTSGTCAGSRPSSSRMSSAWLTDPNAARTSAAGRCRPVTRTRRWRSASRSASGPSATTRPWSRMTTRSQTRSTSVSRWEFRKMVVPRSRRSWSRWRISSRPTGSRAEVGSSRKMTAGSPSSATARPRRCCMPFE